MKMVRLVLLLFIITNLNIFSQGITDIIKPLHLQTGKADTILISDIFYSDNYNLNFLPDKNASIEYNKVKKTLIVKPDKQFEGLDVIDFKVNDSVYTMPYYSRYIPDHTFSLRLKNHPEKVNLFGSFNGWNRESLPMTYNKKNGNYSVSVPLEPGIYQYKYYIQGSEILDPANRDSIPNGLGGYNSVVVIPDLHPEKSYLFVNGYERNKDGLTVSFTYRNNKYREPVKREEIIALYNNSAVPQERISTAANKFLVTVDST